MPGVKVAAVQVDTGARTETVTADAPLLETASGDQANLPRRVQMALRLVW